MVSLDPELSKLFILLMPTSGPFGSQNGPTLANFLKRKLETSFLQHESKIEDSLLFFPDNETNWAQGTQSCVMCVLYRRYFSAFTQEAGDNCCIQDPTQRSMEFVLQNGNTTAQLMCVCTFICMCVRIYVLEHVPVCISTTACLLI